MQISQETPRKTVNFCRLRKTGTNCNPSEFASRGLESSDFLHDDKKTVGIPKLFVFFEAHSLYHMLQILFHKLLKIT